MTNVTTVAHSSQHDFSDASPFNGIAPRSSRFNATAILAKVSASGLVIASAGFGCLYAFQTNIGHGVVLASLAVLFAACLELAKPLAVAGAGKAFKNWRIGQGLALTALALTAVAYSLAAETSLMARSRSDAASERAGASLAASDARAKVQALQDEIAALKPSRAVSEIEPLVASLTVALKGADCQGWLPDKKARDKCIDRNTLESEMGRAQHRADLDGRLAAAEIAASVAPVAKVADPGAVALSTWFGALGFAIAPDKLADWMTLIGILALEIGSALAGVLVAATSVATTPVAASGLAWRSATGSPRVLVTGQPLPAIEAVLQSVQPVALTSAVAAAMTTAVEAVTAGQDGLFKEVDADDVAASATVPMTPVLAAGRDEAAQRILAVLHDSPAGSLDGSRSQLSRLIAATPSTAYAALILLADAGRVTVHATPRGSVVRLVAA